jgi:hypothetical protein
MNINQSVAVLTLLDSMISEQENKTCLAARLPQSDIPEGALLDNLVNSLALQSLSLTNYIPSLHQKIMPAHGAVFPNARHAQTSVSKGIWHLQMCYVKRSF